MIFPTFFDSKNSLSLFELKEEFSFLLSLFLKNKFPKVLMLTGPKGSGKSTLIIHFLHKIFDNNYDSKNFTISSSSNLYSQFQNDIFPNIIYLKGSEFKTLKVDDIRNLKKGISQSLLSNKERFIILDDVELFNIQSLNALLKMIEEPNKSNFFILINNKSKPILETIKSRSIEIKIILDKKSKLNITKNLISKLKLDCVLDHTILDLTPGNFIKFNHIYKEYEISLNNNLLDKITLFLDLFKKTKHYVFIDIVFFTIDQHFKIQPNKNNNIYEIKDFIFTNLHKFLTYNISQNALINAISNKIR